jgi:hypothetical protein
MPYAAKLIKQIRVCIYEFDYLVCTPQFISGARLEIIALLFFLLLFH